MLFKKLALCSLFFLFAACGWQPVYYRSDSKLPIETAFVDVLPVPEENGRLLVQQLKDLLNPQNLAKEKKYTLSVSLEERLDTEQGILGDNTATRATMRMTARFRLMEKDKVLLTDTAFSTSSYNILMLPYPTVTAENTTRKRLIDVLADKIAMRLAVYFKTMEQSK